jgi:hypothetical protein
MLDTMDKPQTAAVVVGAPLQAPFTLKRLKALRAPKPKLWGEADLSPVPATLLDWYWHGTKASNIPSILEHGLLPERTQTYHRTCLAARAHAAHFWGRLQLVFDRSKVQDAVAFIRIPGSMLQTSNLFIEQGSLLISAYGKNQPSVVKGAQTKWDDTDWAGFQAAFGCISTTQTLRVTPEMITTVPFHAGPGLVDSVLAELDAGVPPAVDPGLR